MLVNITVTASDGTTQVIPVDIKTNTVDPGVLPYWGAPTWRDEFDGPAIDTSKWRIRDNDYMSYDLATIMARNCAIRNKQLVITGKKETVKADRPYTTGYIDTIGKSSFKFGKWEMRAKLNTTTTNDSRGIWPAFWLRADTKTGEIDIMEAWGTPLSNPQWVKSGGYQVTIHENTSGAGAKVGTAIAPLDGVPLNKDFHTYGVEWYPDKMVFMLDGKAVKTMTADAVGPWFTTSMADNFNIRLNLQVGCTFQGNPDANTIFPTEYIVDYVRYWKLPV